MRTRALGSWKDISGSGCAVFMHQEEGAQRGSRMRVRSRNENTAAPRRSCVQLRKEAASHPICCDRKRGFCSCGSMLECSARGGEERGSHPARRVVRTCRTAAGSDVTDVPGAMCDHVADGVRRAVQTESPPLQRGISTGCCLVRTTRRTENRRQTVLLCDRILSSCRNLNADTSRTNGRTFAPKESSGDHR